MVPLAGSSDCSASSVELLSTSLLVDRTGQDKTRQDRGIQIVGSSKMVIGEAPDAAQSAQMVKCRGPDGSIFATRPCNKKIWPLSVGPGQQEVR
jgi:hypothetical protein